MEAVRRSTPIEDLVREWPSAVHFMIEKGLPCITCGEPVWGTFEEVARRSGKTEAEIDVLTEELQSRVQTGEGK
jgi:Ni,Fe-hydrogenase I small subunit